jgi:SWI/SNF-related matrix-associated actin-dependent regulator of chromatin subfamily A3
MSLHFYHLGNSAETGRHVSENTLKVHKYHGNQKEKNLQALADHDIVLTTYATLAKEYTGGKSILYDIRWYRVVLDEGMGSTCQQH